MTGTGGSDGFTYELDEYDLLGRLAKVTNENTVATYKYKANGLRMSKTTSLAGGAAQTVSDIWDGSNIIAEADANGNITDLYVRGINLVKRMPNSVADYRYYLYNAHGDVTQLTGGIGTVTKKYKYDAFGVEADLDESDQNPFRYCGEYFDSETGTYYLRSRYYSPRIARFTQADAHWNPYNMIYGDNPTKLREYKDALGLSMYTYAPNMLAMRQSANLYAYCMNNPLYFIDPTGNLAWPGEIHQAVQNYILYGDPHGLNGLNFNAMMINMGLIPSLCGRYLVSEVKIAYGLRAIQYFGRLSGRADIVDINTGEIWEIKSNMSGTGLADAKFDITG